MLQPPKPKSTPKRAVAVAAFPPCRDRDAAIVGMCQAGPDMHLTRAGHQGGGYSCPQPNKPADGGGMSRTSLAFYEHCCSAGWATMRTKQLRFSHPAAFLLSHSSVVGLDYSCLKAHVCCSSATLLTTVSLVSTTTHSVLAGDRAPLG